MANLTSLQISALLTQLADIQKQITLKSSQGMINETQSDIEAYFATRHDIMSTVIRLESKVETLLEVLKEKQEDNKDIQNILEMYNRLYKE